MPKPVWGKPFGEFAAFLMVPDPPPVPLVEGLILKPGTYGMLFGEASSAKSLVAQALIVSLASGRPFAGHFAVPEGPCNVMFLDLDQGENTTMRRFAKLTNWNDWDEADKEMLGNRIFLYSPALPGRLVAEEGTEAVERANRSIQELWGELSENQIDVLVVDCLVSTLGGMDENKAGVARAYFETVKWLQEKSLEENRPLTVVILHHQRKAALMPGGGKLPAQDDMRGSGAWRDSLDFQVKAWKKGDVVVLTKLKERNSEFPEWRASFRLVDSDDSEGNGHGLKLKYEPDAVMRDQGQVLQEELLRLTGGKQEGAANMTEISEFLKVNYVKGVPHSRMGIRPILFALCAAKKVKCSLADWKARDPNKRFWVEGSGGSGGSGK